MGWPNSHDAKGRITLVTARGLRCIIAGIRLLKHRLLSDRGNTTKRLIIVRNHYWEATVSTLQRQIRVGVKVKIRYGSGWDVTD